MIRELYTLIQKANLILFSDMLRSTLSSCSTSNLNSKTEKKNCYLGFSEDTLPEGKNLQYFILDQPVVSNRIRDIWHLVLVNWYGSYFHSTTVVWWTIFLLVHPPRKYDICRWSWQEWWTGLFRLFWCLSAQKIVYGGHASNHFFWYFAWALIKVIFQSAGQRTTPRIR